MEHGLKTLLLSLSLLLALNLQAKTLKVDTVTPSVSNGDFTITPNGSGDIVFGTLNGVLRGTSGTVSAGNVNMSSEVTGVLPIANGGTNSSTALNNNFVMISSGGAIAESASVSTTELNYLDGLTSAIVELTGSQTITGTKTFSSDILMSGTGQIDVPSGTTAQRSGSPNAGMFRFNSDDNQFEGYDGSAWGAIGGGGGGNNLNLVPDFSFESGVSEGTCTSCTATQETSTSIVKVTDNNTAALKMAFSAASGDYTDTITTGSQFTNVSSKVSAWIKTSASDCHLVEMVDGAESQTVAVSSEDEWKLYEIYGTTGATSYGYRVECNTSITDDVYVDEVYAGPVVEPIFDVAGATYFGSVAWEATANCVWQSTSTSFAAFSADADCDDNARTKTGLYNSTNIDAANADGQLPQIKFSYIPAGKLVCTAKGLFYQSTSMEVSYRFNDGTNSTLGHQFVSGSSGIPIGGNQIRGTFEYTTPQTSETTIQIQAKGNSANTYSIYSENAERQLKIECYHYPSPQKVFASKCDGLECENTFSAKVSSSGVVSDENVDWINGNCTMSSGNSTCTFQTSLFGVAPNCTSSNNDGNSRVTLTAAESTSSVSTYIRLTTTAAAADSAYILTCQRAGSDYNQFDQRFVPVENGNIESFSAKNQSNLYDSTGAVKQFNDALLIDSKNGAALSTSEFIEINNVSSTDRITAKKNISITITAGGTLVGGSDMYIKDSSGTQLSIDNTPNTGYQGEVNATVNLAKDDYIYIEMTNANTRSGYITITAQPSEKKAFIGNLTPTEFVQTPGSVKPVVYSLKFGGASLGTNCTGSPCTILVENSNWVDSVTRSTTGTYVVNFTSGAFSTTPVCTCSSFSHGVTGRVACGSYVITTSSMTLNTADTGNNMQDTENDVICHGVQ